MSGDYGTQVQLQMGDYAEQEDAVAVAILSQESGIESYDFQEGTMTVTVTDAESGGVTTYDIKVSADDADATKVTDKCLFCPEKGDAAGSAAPEDGDAPSSSAESKTPVTCAVVHATLLDEICTCDKGWVGALELNEETRVWEGSCVREPVQGAWPCQGEAPFKCGECPSCQDAAAIMDDLTKSCNIPASIKLSELVWHTESDNLATVHPDLKETFCMSPICRWRIELAFNSFATCQALGSKYNARSQVTWREDTLSLHAVKHLIEIFHSAKDSCGQVRAAQQTHSSVEVYQKFLVTGVDVRTDATMRQGELAFRQAFSKILGLPVRRLDVRLEAEMCNLDPVCDHDKCGFGECVPWSARETPESLASGGVFSATETYDVRHPFRKGKYGYRCLCNECFTEQVVNGERTCVRDATCEPKNYCDPNP